LISLLKTNAQKKWAVKTRPFGREAHIVTRPAPGCKRLGDCVPEVVEAKSSPSEDSFEDFAAKYLDIWQESGEK
jgi:hypothetical protein